MKKLLTKVSMAVAAVILLSSCGMNMHLASNHNVNQTNVVLSQNNFHVVKTVEAEVSANYLFGLGGIGRKALHNNAVAELTKEADLTGAQALINVTVHQSARTILFFTSVIYHAEGTVIEFDRGF